MIDSLSPSALQSLATGGLYLLCWALASNLAALIARHMRRKDSPLYRRALASRAWGYLGRILGLAASMGFLYVALMRAYVDPLHIGLDPVAWGELAPWLPAVAGISSLWCAVLWGNYWRRYTRREDHSPSANYGTPLGLPAHVLNLELQATLLRGAFIPALGTYWGAWAAVGARALAAWANPALRARMGNSQVRAFAYLDLGVDVLAAGCFIVSGSLWVSLGVRAATQLAACIVHRVLFWQTRAKERRLPATVAQRPV